MGEEDLKAMLGDPRKAVRRMVVPFILSILTVQVNVFADTFWVSGLGIDAVSGMTSAIPLYTLITSIGIGLAVGVTATIAFRLGKGDMESASSLAGNAIAMGALLSIAVAMIIVAMIDPVVSLMGADDVRSEVREYLVPLALLSPLIVLNTVFGGLLRSEGSARRSTVVQVSAAVVNIVLDPLLIYGAGMGLAGAGLATGLASGAGILVAARWFLTGRTSISVTAANLRIRRGCCEELMAIAAPRSVEGIVMSMVILFQRIFIIMASGTPGVSLFNVPFRYVSLSMCPSEATGMAMVPVAASAYGQGNMDRMKESMRYSMRLALSSSLILMVVLFLMSDVFISIFTTDPSMGEWKDAFVWNMRMYCVILPFFTIQTIGSSMLQAMKRAKRPMEITMVLGVVRMVLFWLCCGYGYVGITYALIASYVLSAALMMIMARHEMKAILRAS